MSCVWFELFHINALDILIEVVIAFPPALVIYGYGDLTLTPLILTADDGVRAMLEETQDLNALEEAKSRGDVMDMVVQVGGVSA
jgi:hypothetical protein